MPKTMNNRAMATYVAEFVRTAGGYIHSGCVVHGDVWGLFQSVWDCTENYTPNQGDVAANKRRMLDAPVGARVMFSTRPRKKRGSSPVRACGRRPATGWTPVWTATGGVTVFNRRRNVYMRTEKPHFHPAPLSPVLQAQAPTDYDLYYERSPFDPAILNPSMDGHPRAMGYVATGTLESGSAPTRRLVVTYRTVDAAVDVFVTQAGDVWWNAQGEEDWEQDSGEGFPGDMPAELAALIQ